MAQANEITTHFIKTEDYKTSFVTGVFGGLTQQGLIHLNHFVDRPVVPKSVNYTISKEKNTLEEVSREAKDGTVREVNGAILFDTNMAKQLIVWLQGKIDEFEALPKQKI